MYITWTKSPLHL